MSFSTRTLAYVLDSLVRVSRRDSKNHFLKITIVPQASNALIGLAFFDISDFILSVEWRSYTDFVRIDHFFNT
jgi:hypothetical protein